MEHHSQSLPPQQEQGVASWHSSNPRRRYIPLFAAALLLISGGTVVWVLNVVDIIPGPWSNVFVAIFTGSAIILALLDLWMRLMGGKHGEQ